MLEVIYSNRIEELFHQFINKELTHEADPFIQRIVVVPGPAVKTWLTERLAQSEFQTSLGYKIVLLDEALFTLRRATSQLTQKIPSRMELMMALENEMEAIEEIAPFLNKGGRKELRRYHFSAYMASLFQKYGRFSPSILSGWQKELWDRVFKNSNWCSPHEFYSETLTPPTQKIRVDLFALSYLTPHEFMFLKELSQFTPIHFWLLSPCLHFWSDFLSEREQKSLLSKATEKTRGDLKHYLEDSHPLLANFGKLRRDLATLVESELPDHTQAYLVSDEALAGGDYEHFEEAAEIVEEKSSLLKFLQTDLLYLRNPQKTPPISLPPDDRSLQFHRLPTKLREVEWAKDLILQLYCEGKTDILVAAPDIDLYVPYIERVFHDIPYSLTGKKSLKEHPLILLLDYYLHPEESSLLFKLAPFCGFEPEEIAELEKWRETFSLTWATSDPLVYGYMEGKIPLSDLELVSKWDNYLRTLKKLTPPQNSKLHEWVEWLQKLPLPYEEEIGEKMLKQANLNLSFYAFAMHTQERLLSLKESAPQHQLGQIRFSSLKESSALPCQALLLLGMAEGAFPRSSPLPALDLSRGEGFPTHSDYDGSLFLDILLSTRENLFFLWSGSHEPAQAPAALRDYLKVAFQGCECTFYHPENNYDPLYFQEGSPLRSFSSSLRAASQIKPEESPPRFFADFTPSLSEKREMLSLRELTSLLKGPLEFHLKTIGLKKSQKGSFREDSFKEAPYHLDGLEAWKVKNALLKGKPPTFSLNSEAPLKEALKGLKELVLREEVAQYLSENSLTEITPLPFIPSEELPLYGTIPHAAKEGIVSLGSHAPEELVKVWPEFLAAAALNPAIRKIYCLKSLKTVEVKLDRLKSSPKELLQELLTLAARAKEAPYPLTPKCYKELVKGGFKELSKELEKIDPGHDAELIAKRYQPEAARFFGPLMESL